MNVWIYFFMLLLETPNVFYSVLLPTFVAGWIHLNCVAVLLTALNLIAVGMSICQANSYIGRMPLLTANHSFMACGGLEALAFYHTFFKL